MTEHQAIRAANRQWHSAHESTDGLINDGSIIAECPIKSSVKELQVVACALRYRVPKHLRQFMVRKHHMHLPRERKRQLRHATQHAVTEINTVDEPVTVDQFMEH